MVDDIDDFLDQLVEKGGAIVSSNEASIMEIADARATDRIYIREEDSLGFIRRPQEWINKKGVIPSEDDVQRYVQQLLQVDMSDEERNITTKTIYEFYNWIVRKATE